jgi:acylphosphatase
VSGGAGPAVRFRVQGRVQGVGFRWFVMRECSRLQLAGYVRNLADGSVEVVARGPDAELTLLERALSRGPSMARIDSVEKHDLSHESDLPTSFEIW